MGSRIKHTLTAFFSLHDPTIDGCQCTPGNAVFGPVNVRHLGCCLGVRGGTPHCCTYACLYCHDAEISDCSISRAAHCSPYELCSSVESELEQLGRDGRSLDYIMFVPNGEPTLDRNLATEIRLLREFGCKSAVITNSSLLWNPNVLEDLLFADLVCLKIDTVQEQTWRLLNRPHRRLVFDLVLRGIEEFAKATRGTLTTESVLVNEVNDSREEIKELAGYLAGLKERSSYFALPLSSPGQPGRREETAQFVMDVLTDATVTSMSFADEFIAAARNSTERLPLR